MWSRLARLAFAALLAAGSPSLAAPLFSRGRDARTSLVGVDGVQKLVLDRSALAALRASDHVVVPAFPLGTRRTADLVLERFTPFTDGAHADVVDGNGPRPVALPDHAYFRGTVAGEDDSLVVLVAAPDAAHGFVASGGDVFPFGPDARGGHRSYALRDADPALYPPPGDFCANDLHPEAVAMPAAEPAPPVAAASTSLRLADVAIDTDQELRNHFASDADALDYLASLAAATTAIYERDVAVRLRFSYVRLWDSADPWTATTPTGALDEVRAYWNDPTNDMATIAGPRTVVHFVSGKSVQGGVAYVNVLCSPGFGYGVSQVYGSFDLSQPSQIWDVLVVAHEVGHNFGSPHTHCYSPPVDECYNQESGCYSGPVVASRGTIMSYCHLLAGGLANIDMLFGSVVSARIGQSVAAAPCLGTVPDTTTTTIPGATTTTSSPTTSTTGSTTTTRSTTSSTSTTRATTTTTSTTTTTRASTSTTVRPTTTTTTPQPSAGDADGDGVPDDIDACPGTPAGDLVDATGCSICPCDGPRAGGAWASRSAYLGCVRAEVKRVAGRRRVQRAALDGARHSSCGRPRATRCCLYGGPADATGRCRVTSRAVCASAVASGDAANMGRGTCLPSPCPR